MRSAEAIDAAIVAAHNNGKTYAELAEELGITYEGLLLKRKGIRPWKWSEVVKLSECLQVPIDSLAGDD